MKTSKKINAGDTLTVGDLTDEYLGAVIEVGPEYGITLRLKLGRIRVTTGLSVLWNVENHCRGFTHDIPVTIITPPPVKQPDEPTAFGQCIRIEGYDEWWALVADPGSIRPIRDVDGEWLMWGTLLKFAGDDRIIVSDPPRWPDETPEVPERIEAGEWPEDDTHLRGREWIDRYGSTWCWEVRGHKSGWTWIFGPTTLRRPSFGPWLRGERVN